MFDYLPIAAIIDEKVFCVHGGLSPTLHYIDDIKQIQRVQEIPHEGPFCDMMWSDPNDNDVDGWSVSPRGAGYLFGITPTEQFCHRNDVQLICRAHQLVMTGYKTMFNDKLVTVWSAPNYGYRCGNDASIL